MRQGQKPPAMRLMHELDLWVQQKVVETEGRKRQDRIHRDIMKGGSLTFEAFVQREALGDKVERVPSGRKSASTVIKRRSQHGRNTALLAQCLRSEVRFGHIPSYHTTHQPDSG